MQKDVFTRKRDFTVLNSVGVCATTKEQFVKEVMNLPTSPISATVTLIGIPAAVMAREHTEYADIYNNATIAAIDGMPIVKMGRRKEFVCERCSAPDTMGLLFQESVRQGKSHFFYGGKDEEVLAKLRNNLENSYPGIKIVGMYSPPFRPLTEEEDITICEGINQLHPDFLWIGIGAPKQEIWMMAHREKISETTMLGVGAGFDFFAGTLKKSPKWMETAGLEWLFRLMVEPKRLWKRYVYSGAKYIYYSVKDRIYKHP